MSRIISPDGLPVASGLSREACQRIAAELGDGYTVEPVASWKASVSGYDRLGNVHTFRAAGTTRHEALEAAIDLAPEITVTSAIAWPVGGTR